VPDLLIPPSIFKLDPTGTQLLRRDWEREAKRRNDEFRKLITVLLIVMLLRPRFDMDSFLAEAQNVFDQKFLGGSGISRFWFSVFITRAFRQGLLDAYNQVNPPKGGRRATFEAGQRSAFMLSASSGQTDAVAESSTRAMLSFESTRSAFLSAAAHIVTQGIKQGYKPAFVARSLGLWVSKVMPKRLVLPIDHETSSAFVDGQLDAFEELGITEVGADVEFTTVAGTGASEQEMIRLRVCPKCRRLSGEVYTTQKARGVIPVHPRCRCRWTPR
jgi:hypothetical protein